MKTELLHTFVADPRSVPAIARLPDGTLITGGSDGHLRRWDPAHWIELAAVDAHGKGVRALHVGAGRIVSVGGDRTLRVWAGVGGHPLFAASRRIGGLSTDRWIVGNSSRGRVCLHDPETGELKRRLPRLDDDVRCITAVPDAVIAGGVDGVYRLPLTGGPVGRWSQSAPVIAVHADGHGVCAVHADGRVAAWSVDGHERWAVQADGAVPQAIRTSPDGQRIAVSMAYQIQLLDRTDGRTLGTIKSRLKGLFGLVWSADGERLYCGAADGRVRVWGLGG